MEAIIAIGVTGLLLWLANRWGTKVEGQPPKPVSAPEGGRMPTQFETRLSWDTEDESNPHRMVDVFARGPFPVLRQTHAAFIISVLDGTDAEATPVLSPVAVLQEAGTIAFQHSADAGVLLPGQCLNNWARIASIPLWLLQASQSGTRELLVIVRLIDLSTPPPIKFGLCPSHAGILWVKVHPLHHTFTNKGYVESVEHRREAQEIALQCGVALAMIDGTLHEAEGVALQRWATRTVDHLNGEERDQEKARLNNVIREAFASARNGRLRLDDLIARLNHIGEPEAKYEVLDFCFELMAADKQATHAEMSMLARIAKGLDLDMDEFHALRDKALMGVTIPDGASGASEHLIGIDPSWDRGQVLTHLKTEFRKWNARMNTLEAGAERANAQKMLDAVAALRKRHE